MLAGKLGGAAGEVGAIRKWEFESGAEKIEVAVEGSLITNDLDHVVRAALNGIGISYVLKDHISSHIAAGRLVRVVEKWPLPSPGSTSSTRAATRRHRSSEP